MMTPKILLTAIAALAIAIGFALPGPRAASVNARSQIPMQEIGQG
jgi:hypothetical protein